MTPGLSSARDGLTGPDYADQRYYASGYGRFNTPDPYRSSGFAVDPSSWNRYSYTRGDPVNRNDRHGLADWSVTVSGDDEESKCQETRTGCEDGSGGGGGGGTGDGGGGGGHGGGAGGEATTGQENAGFAQDPVALDSAYGAQRSASGDLAVRFAGKLSPECQSDLDAVGPVDSAQTMMERAGAKSELTQRGGTLVKYGTYDVIVSAAGFTTARLTALINQPRQFISVAMAIGSIDGPERTCSITVRVLPEGSATRLRAMAVFGSYVADVVVDRQGSYALLNLECGDYMLLAMGLKGCMAVQYPRIVLDSRIDLTITEPPGSSCLTISK